MRSRGVAQRCMKYPEDCCFYANRPSIILIIAFSVYYIAMEYWQILRNSLGSQQLIIPSAVGAILDDERILLAKRAHSDNWHIPGGVQDLNESITDTIERELREELGLRLQVDRLISVISDPRWIKSLSNGHILQTLMFFFLMKGYDSSIPITVDRDEISTYDFFKLDRLPEDTEECCKLKCNDLLHFDGTVKFH
jgi:ADP-ribose pyrophosphatase YjhB (NUDIX family)